MNKFWTITVAKGHGAALASHLAKTVGAYGEYVGWVPPSSPEEMLAIYIPAHKEEEFMNILENDPNVIWYQEYDRDDDNLPWN